MSQFIALCFAVGFLGLITFDASATFHFGNIMFSLQIFSNSFNHIYHPECSPYLSLILAFLHLAVSISSLIFFFVTSVDFYFLFYFFYYYFALNQHCAHCFQNFFMSFSQRYWNSCTCYSSCFSSSVSFLQLRKEKLLLKLYQLQQNQWLTF